ncbi:hypothetical protein ACH9L7_04125 [Haloferax sp. S1W]|uniref:hypothetical protein n=1 Tax=Haloferax sp. S1W TaxID=3377110 RepID=UPI0037C8FF3A
MSTDEYRRGRAVERERKKRNRAVSGRYRGVIPVIYGIGLIIFLGASLFIGPESAFAVYLVTHLFYAGLIRGDIKSLRKQDIDWGFSRHAWFGAALTLPFVAPAYYLYSRRVIHRENQSRGVVD